MKILIVISVLSLSNPLFALEEMQGMGDYSCEKWLRLDAILKSESGMINLHDATMQWVSGFISGVNVVSASENGEYLDISTLMSDMDTIIEELKAYCENNSNNFVAEFVVDKMEELKVLK